ncbi:MAG: epoxide hydrolase [Schumannella sp.]|nr:epoxide hydrolase [Schumannella sp.]
MPAFTIAVADEVLDDLRHRLRATRFARPRVLTDELVAARTDPRFPHPTAPGWEAGVDPAYLRSLVAYWADGFDWRAAEARLNAYPQFIERGMHFVHIRRDATRPPVILTHGWPSTFAELLPLADLLDVDVVVPSLPGYLYSDLLDEPMTRKAIGEGFHTLMTDVLGYERYFAFGGDIGGSACGWAAAMHPQQVAGLHVIHGPFPGEYVEPLTAAEQRWLESDEVRGEQDGGYDAILASRPDTIAAAMQDSPAGMAAFILDKLWAWSDGPLETRFDRDALCTIFTLYWATASFDSSLQQDVDAPLNPRRPTITVPVAVTQSREWNMPLFPRSIADRAASDIRLYEAAPSGGHFMGYEEPAYVADRLTALMREVG